MLSIYRQRIEVGELSPDPAQEAVAVRLDALAAAMHRLERPGVFGLGRSREAPPKGLYIWGGVGRGKSMLMDLFHRTTQVTDRRRVHFHDFMLETHAFIHAWRGLSGADRKRHPAFVRDAGDDPIAPAAKAIRDRARLLCFDEFHVTSIADAMILSRLFGHVFDRGVVMVATSNRRPRDLYHNGINRELFLPFVDRLEREMDVIELPAARDYRLDRLAAAPVYYTPLGPEADARMDEAFARITGGAPIQPAFIEAQGRRTDIPVHADGCARASFADLCARPLGAADFLALARRFHTVLLDRTPLLTPDRRNEAARFVTLIDALYETRTKLVMSAAAPPEALYPAGDGAFEFQRTASRLHEMRSQAYLAGERIETGER
ncbi:cell division protein ZapE [bacterium]|nr:cell division protein ZapE [bacterium]